MKGSSDVLLVVAASFVGLYAAMLSLYGIFFRPDKGGAIAGIGFTMFFAAVVFGALKRLKRAKEADKTRPKDRRPRDWKGNLME
jgi:hypothetical protein